MGDLYPKRRNEWKLKLGSLNIIIRYVWDDLGKLTDLGCLIRPEWLLILSSITAVFTTGFILLLPFWLS